MRVEGKGTQLWFDVEGAALETHGATMRSGPPSSCTAAQIPSPRWRAAREIVDALPEGIGRLQVLEGAGHLPWMDVPDRYWPLLTEFVLAPKGE
jgi:pimeloyl-ACP methyl ester carboxylesterase